MAMTLEDRVRALEPLGFTSRQTRFITLVALHSGYCLRRQYAALAGIRYGKSVCDFFGKLVARGLATDFIQRADRGRIYHLQARAIYRAIGEPEHRNRREASAAVIARRMMVLDYVLVHADVAWLSTEEEKVDLFARFGVLPRDLPQRASAALRTEATTGTRYFRHEAPVAVVGDPPVATFVCLVTDTTGRMLEQFLREHGRLFASLPAWTVVAIGPSPTGLRACEVAFERYRRRPIETVSASTDDLVWFFRTRHAVDQGNLTGLSVTAIDRFRTMREAFRRPVFDELYLAWQRDGDAVLTSSAASALHHGNRSVGTLVTELLPFDYSQFGSLPGIA
jgi:hypothetical protein